MANKILSVVSYKELMTDLKRESKKELEKVNWDVAAGKCMSVYRQLI